MGLAIALVVLALIVGVLYALAILLPAARAAQERARIEREAQEASWQIHAHANQAFGQMLKAARETRDQPGGPEDYR